MAFYVQNIFVEERFTQHVHAAFLLQTIRVLHFYYTMQDAYQASCSYLCVVSERHTFFPND